MGRRCRMSSTWLWHIAADRTSGMPELGAVRCRRRDETAGSDRQ
jgi:hypothetical protein